MAVIFFTSTIAFAEKADPISRGANPISAGVLALLPAELHEAFHRELIDDRTVLTLTEEDLRDILGVTRLGPRRLILQFLEEQQKLEAEGRVAVASLRPRRVSTGQQGLEGASLWMKADDGRVVFGGAADAAIGRAGAGVVSTDGAFRLGSAADGVCSSSDAATAGTLRYNTAKDALQVCRADGEWASAGGGAADGALALGELPAAPDTTDEPLVGHLYARSGLVDFSSGSPLAAGLVGYWPLNEGGGGGSATCTSSLGHSGRALNPVGHACDGNWGNIWDVQDNGSYPGNWFKIQYQNAFVARAVEYKPGQLYFAEHFFRSNALHCTATHSC